MSNVCSQQAKAFAPILLKGLLNFEVLVDIFHVFLSVWGLENCSSLFRPTGKCVIAVTVFSDKDKA